MAVKMPEEPTQALRFGKARTARSAALLEDYVELIADLLAAHGEARAIDVAKRLGVTHPTAIKSIARLKREGLATARPYRGIFLTEAGRDLLERATPLVHESERGYAGTLTEPERDELIATLRRLGVATAPPG